jgi:hypothetical protein
MQLPVAALQLLNRPRPRHLPNPHRYVGRSLAGHTVPVLQYWFDRLESPSAQVYVIPSEWIVGAIGAAPEFVYFSDRAAGLTIMVWREGSHTFLLVSDRPEAELRQWFGDAAEWT